MHRSTTLIATARSGAEATSSTPPPASGERADAVRQRIDRALGEWLAGRRTALAGEVPEVDEMIVAVTRLASGGGKRLRPALVHAAWRIAGGEPDARFDASEPSGITALALATELLHTYLLIHDDVMDHAALRRGVPTVHTSFEERHRETGLKGDGADFGTTAAILAGDLAHSWAHELFARAVVPLTDAGRRLALARAFAAMTEEVVAGQYLEVLLARRGTASEAELGQVLRLKSGRYSVERPLELGALYAGAPPRLAAALARCGRALGEAFQLQDDLLGTFGDSGEVGKPVASDLAEGKITFLVHHALAAAPPDDAELLAGSLGRGDLDTATVAELRRILVGSGARDRVEAMAAERVAAARRALAEAADETPRSAAATEGLALLAELVDQLAERRQ
ncbi:MAG TPA: polyprenyl synthetase family protein [Thermoanaerobaculia bacterium]|nr:polyprenyl synthetase family protein [Thermoanaerobaculia bacterium]